jgi:hypothetical protein
MADCCLCRAIGESSPGRVPDGGGFPMCAEHRARSTWQSRYPKPPRTITIGAPSYGDVAAARMIAEDDSLSLASALAGLIAPTSRTLQ